MNKRIRKKKMKAALRATGAAILRERFPELLKVCGSVEWAAIGYDDEVILTTGPIKLTDFDRSGSSPLTP